jgi:exodeoxyribonuclease-1
MYLPNKERTDADPAIALKQVHVNKCPILAPAGMLNKEEAARFAIIGDECRAHLAILRNYPELKSKLADVISEDNFESDGDPDHMLYSGGFFNDTDKKMMQQVRESDPNTLAELEFAFQDPRLEEMLLRYRARNYPWTLSDEQQSQWEQYRSDKLLVKDKRRLLTMKEFYEHLNSLYQDQNLATAQREILEELAIYAESIYPMDVTW